VRLDRYVLYFRDSAGCLGSTTKQTLLVTIETMWLVTQGYAYFTNIHHIESDCYSIIIRS